MSFPPSPQTGGLPSWWLDGPEMCLYCCHRYVLEWEFRCIECDHAVCPLCAVVVRESTTVYCPDCTPQENAS